VLALQAARKEAQTVLLDAEEAQAAQEAYDARQLAEATKAEGAPAAPSVNVTFNVKHLTVNIHPQED
jgi:hypothetical protein